MSAAKIKEKLQREQEDRLAVREFEKKRAAAGAAFMEAGLDDSQEAIQLSVSGDNLNQLWERVRYFFQDKDQYGVDLTRPMKKPAKDRFL